MIVNQHDALAADTQLVAMLRTIAARETDAPLDNVTLRRTLGWTAAKTAASLDVARSRLLIWGVRIRGVPGPCFEDLELTVQGRRLIAAVDAVTNDAVSADARAAVGGAQSSKSGTGGHGGRRTLH